MTNSSNYARAGQSLVDLAGPKNKASTRAKLVPAGRVVKGRVAKCGAHTETRAAHTDTRAAHTDCAREERTIPAPTSPAAAPTVACAIVTGSGSGCAVDSCTSNGVIAEIGTDAIGAAHRAAMNARNAHWGQRTSNYRGGAVHR